MSNDMTDHQRSQEIHGVDDTGREDNKTDDKQREEVARARGSRRTLWKRY